MSGFVDRTASAVEHCQSMSALYPELASKYDQMAEFCRNKLWHQLTLAVLDFVQDETNRRFDSDAEASANQPEQHNFYQLYDKVVVCVESKLDQLSLCRIASAVAFALMALHASGHSSRLLDTAREILQQLLQGPTSEGESSSPNAVEQEAKAWQAQPRIFLQSKLYLLDLQTQVNNSSDNKQQIGSETLTTIKETIGKNQKILLAQDGTAHGGTAAADELASSDSAIVHAAHYELAMNYYRVVGPPEAFYEQAMRFIAYAPSPESPGAGTSKYPQLAVDIILAGLTGDGVYNLGHLEQTTVLEFIDKDQQWLVEILKCTAMGEVDTFAQLSQKYAAQIQAQPVLVQRSQALQEKLTLLALVTLVLEKGSHERLLSFDDIATRLRITAEQVEWVLMRAISVGLIQGMIDQVEQTIEITHVMPRSLNSQQLQDLASRYGEWANKVTETRKNMLEQTPALFV